MKIRVFEAFAGYGSQSIALELLAQAFPDFQFDTVGISEIDKNAIKAYRTLHGKAIPNHGDITKIDWTQTADFDLLTYSFPCKTFLRQANNVVSPRVAVHALPACGPAPMLLKRSIHDSCLWRMSRHSPRKRNSAMTSVGGANG